MTRHHAALWAALWLVPLHAHAQSRDMPARVRVRHDTILNMAPRYELRLSEDADSPSRRFWHRVEQLPVYERVTLDADGLAGGAVDTHILAWAAGDALMPDDGQAASGDFATAYARARLLPPLHVWGGRRFVTWGLPGGLHLDGIGVEQRSELGFHAEALAGRPVSAVFTTLGSHSEYEEPTFAYGARMGFDQPGKVSSAVSFMQRTAHGIVADRTVMGTVAFRPDERIDLLGSGTVGVENGLQEARGQVAYLISSAFEPDVSVIHAEPQKLLPSWSILSMFASDAYDEGALGMTARLSPAVTGRIEMALRRSYLPGNEVDDKDNGHRVEAKFRYVTIPRGSEFVVELGRRDADAAALLLVRVAASLPVYRALRVAPEVGAAIDEHDSERSAFLLRGAAELPFARRWLTALTVDFARTPVALAEVRGLLRLSYVLDTGRP